jgi:hypothetical protein
MYICISSISRQLFQIRTFSNPTFFDFFENWHNESFKQNKEAHFLFRPKSLPQKNYRVTNFPIFHDFSIILSLITQRVFIAETCVWVRWKEILLSKLLNLCLVKIHFNILFSKIFLKNTPS